MKRKKVLVEGNLNSLQEFFNSPFNRTYDVQAVISENGVNKPIITGGGKIEILQPENLPQFIYKFIDGVILTDRQNLQNKMNYFVGKGLEPRKIILWNNQGRSEIFTAKDQNGVEVCFMEGLQFHIRKQEDLNFVNEMQRLFYSQKVFYALHPSQYKSMIENQYRRKIDWENPKTFTEKIQWLKLYDSTPIKTRLADKYLVKKWVAEKIGEQYVVPLLGVWDNFDDIDFDLLPEQFVLKGTHAFDVIVRDKKTFDKENAREQMQAWMNIDFGSLWFEFHYNNIKKRIIAEKYLSEKDLVDIRNYKFWCFNGEPKFCALETDRAADGNLDNLCIDFFDLNWTHLEMERADHPNTKNPEKLSKPKNFKLMTELAAELCKDFSFVRVDLYEVEGQVYFGEMTFTPGSGLFRYNSAGTDEELGKWLKLPEPTPLPPVSI